LTGYPNQTPWTAIIDPDTASEEVVEVTGVAGTTLTVTRGVDGTSAVQHSAGAVLRHGVSGRDFDEANSHVNTTSGNPHSVTAADVGAVANSLVDAKGDLIAASADNTPARLAVGTNEHRLVADSAEATGLRYVADTTNYAVGAKGDLLAGTAADAVAPLAVGSNGQVLVAASGETTGLAWQGQSEVIGVACSDETTDLATGTGVVTFRMPHAMTLTGVRAGVTTAPTGSTIIVDINEGGTSVLSTKLSIDASEKTSTTAATAAVISDSALADDAEITIDIDQVGSTVAGAGLKVWLIGTKA
jgi:hypothetical protein